VTDQLVLTIGYDRESLTNPAISKLYTGPVTTDYYGRKVPKHAVGPANLGQHTASTRLIMEAVLELYDRVTDPNLLVRRINITANHILPEAEISHQQMPEQLDLFADPEADRQLQAELEREKHRQQAVLSIRKKYGKNAIVKGMNLEEGATAMDRNQQIGGHKA
jgi:DNA polymerase V